MGWPQVVIIILLAINVIGGCILHGEKRADHNAFAYIIYAALTAWLLYSGGFFK